MRLNRYVALATGFSRRKADTLITQSKVKINEHLGEVGQEVDESQDSITLNEVQLFLPQNTIIMLNKPEGYICSRKGQGNKTIYDLLPKEFHSLKPVGRLDKDSSGLLLLTNDGKLAHSLTHPSFHKEKVYQIALNKPLIETDKQVLEHGVQLEDGISQLQLKGRGIDWIVRMQEGRNRQIRRTFAFLGYKVIRLHRTQFGAYKLFNLPLSYYKQL